ncbi:hypothetical protein HNR46_000032 [Haloferula luteola]|uniref:FeoB-associated Cys-rich membrane protein n=1 Tax=Haloferula luteola TaxID=595692 RepID=A0A840VA73_9BACT|nr:FeoB-associated Cys-rich membrane protein [Haloferula luteola]MBB5349811.1 hypothetical protein [Haloferula luteola]
MNDWQSYAAAAIVGITLAILVRRFFAPKKPQGGCGNDCGCGKKPAK